MQENRLVPFVLSTEDHAAGEETPLDTLVRSAESVATRSEKCINVTGHHNEHLL